MIDQIPPTEGDPARHVLDGLTLLFCDFESFYSQSYSLTKMDPASYILDPLFEAICLGCCNLTGDPVLIDGPEIPSFIHRLKQAQNAGRRIAMVSHNAQFDMAIMSWRYDFHPDLIIDTIAISRTILGPMLRSHALDNLAEYFGLPRKGTMVHLVKGMTRADIIANGMWEREKEYCLHDTWLCREIYKRLFDAMPSAEVVLHDIITRCTTDPLLMVDRDLLYGHLAKIQQQKEFVLAQVEQAGIGKSHLMSNQKFADVLRMLGVEPPTKISPTTNEKTFAFAKSDEQFTDLLEHENVMVRAVVEARLETKSTIEETRTKRFIAISELEFPNLGSCMMPMPVIIGAAHTHRVGGGWDLNVQNMGRGSTLRDAIHAPPGYLLVVADSKQIEARDTAWFCDELELLEQFEKGEDVYANFASEVYGFPVDRKIHIPEGFVGKTGILQLGYASGWRKFQNTVRILSRNTPTPLHLTDEEAEGVVQKYRRKMQKITGMWRQLDYVLGTMHTLPRYGEGQGLVMKCVTFYRELMIGPTGLPVRFPGLHFDPFEGSYYFQDGKFLRRTYGASLLETIAQHVARCIVMMVAVRVYQPMARIGARLVHSAHDELVYCVPERHVEVAKLWLQAEFRRRPSWGPTLPLDVDIGVGVRYGDCK